MSLNLNTMEAESYQKIDILAARQCAAYGVEAHDLLSDFATRMVAQSEESAMQAFSAAKQETVYFLGKQTYIPVLPQLSGEIKPSSRSFEQDDPDNSVLSRFNYLYPNAFELKFADTHIDDIISSLNNAEALRNTLRTLEEREVWTIEKNISPEQLKKAYSIFEGGFTHILGKDLSHDFLTFIRVHTDNLGYFLLIAAYLPAKSFLFLINYLYAYNAESISGLMAEALKMYQEYLVVLETLNDKPEEALSADEKEHLELYLLFLGSITAFFERLHFINKCYIKESVYSQANQKLVFDILNRIQLKGGA